MSLLEGPANPLLEGTPDAGVRPIIDLHRLGPPIADHEIAAHDRLVAMRPPAEDAPVVVVVAPAGYGKSTLVSEWATHAQTPVIWLNTDRYLSDPVSLVAHISEATMRAIGPEPSLEAAASRPSATVWSSFVPRLGAVLQRAGPYLMVLDDVHALATPASRDVIDWLALRVPTGSQLVISGRTTEGLRLGNLRVRGDAVTFGTKDLALTDAEALELLREAGITVTALEAHAVNRRCAGWVSGLLMSAARRSSRPGSELLSEQATGSDLVEEYVDAEILAHLSEETREFIKRASLLWTMTASLCDAALERDDSGQQLEELCTSNAFMARLPDGSCRQHELIRFTLRSRIEREQPEACASILRRAALWHADRGEPDAAVKYAQRSGDHELACRLIGSFAVVLMSLGRNESLNSWLDWVERNNLITTDPATTDSGVHIFALNGAPQRSERWASILQATAERSRGPEKARWAPHAHLVGAWQCRWGSAAMLESAARASELFGPDDSLYMSAVGALAIAQLMCGQDEAGMRTMQRLVDERPACMDENAVTVAQVFLARAAMARGDLDEAGHLLQQAGDRRHRLGMGEQGLHALHDAVCARVMLARGGTPEDVQPLLVHAQTVRPQSTWAMPGVAMPIRLELAKAYLALNDVAGARVVLREAFDILHRRPGLGAMEAEARGLRNLVAAQEEAVSGPTALTSAELRLVPWLATHLSFREIGERLFLSTNTVKTEALSTYRKLGVSSRSAAVEAAVKAGLLDPASLPAILNAAAWRDEDQVVSAVDQR